MKLCGEVVHLSPLGSVAERHHLIPQLWGSNTKCLLVVVPVKDFVIDGLCQNFEVWWYGFYLLPNHEMLAASTQPETEVESTESPIQQ